MIALIAGAGAQGRVILDILRGCAGYDSIYFVDDNRARWGTEVNGAPIIEGGLDQAFRRTDSAIIIAVGNPLARLDLGARAAASSARLLNAVHTSAAIMPSVRLGLGNMIGATAVINTDSVVGNHTIINTGAVVEHDCGIGDGAVIGPGAHLGARVSVGKAAFVSTGAIVLSRIRIGCEAVVAAGAIVTSDVPDRTLVMGVPARVREQIGPDFDWNRLL